VRRLDAAFLYLSEIIMTDWPHAPPHRLHESGTYMVTCGTYLKKHWLNNHERLDLLLQLLLNTTHELGWKLHAWSVLSNHYHIIASTEDNPASLRTLISKCHTLSAKRLNQEDKMPGRKVWHQYYESRITFQTSYMARLNYVHFNPARHGVIANATDYPWCSAAWFEKRVRPSFYRTVKKMKTDLLTVYDAYDPISPAK